MQTHLHEFEREVYSLPLLVHSFDFALDLIAWLHDIFRHSYMVPAHVTDMEKPLHHHEQSKRCRGELGTGLQNQSPDCNSQTYGQLPCYRHHAMTVQLYSRNHMLCWTGVLMQKAAAKLCLHTLVIHIVSVPDKLHKRWIARQHQQQQTYMSAGEL